MLVVVKRCARRSLSTLRLCGGEAMQPPPHA
jgi:hypothetical protein